MVWIIAAGIVLALIVIGALASRRPTVEGLLEAAARGDIPVVDRSDEADGEMTDEQAAIVTQVGRFLLAGKLDPAVAFINGHLPKAAGSFRAELLSQRGGVAWMRKDYAAALADYEEAARLDPASETHRENLAEARQKTRK
jgi:hypothetical protein